MASHVPIATYRVQLTKDFGFVQAAALVPYLKSFGISHSAMARWSLSAIQTRSGGCGSAVSRRLDPGGVS